MSSTDRTRTTPHSERRPCRIGRMFETLAALIFTIGVGRASIAADFTHGYWVPYVDSSHFGRSATYNNLSLYSFADSTRVIIGTDTVAIAPWSGRSVTLPTLREGLHLRTDRPISGIYDFSTADYGMYEDGWLSYALVEDRSLGTDYWLPVENSEVSILATENFTTITAADSTFVLHRGETRRLAALPVGSRIRADHPIAVCTAHYDDSHYSGTWALQLPSVDRIGRIYSLPRRHPHGYQFATEASRLSVLALSDGTEVRVNDEVVTLRAGESHVFPLTGEAIAEANLPFYAIALMDVTARDPWTGSTRSYAYAVAPIPSEAGTRSVVAPAAVTSGGHGGPATEVAITSLEDGNVIRLAIAGQADREVTLNRGASAYFHEGEIPGWTGAPLRIRSIRPMQVVHSVRGWWNGVSEMSYGEVLSGLLESDSGTESIDLAGRLPDRRYFLFAPPASGVAGERMSDLLASLGPTGTTTWRSFGIDDGELVEDPPTGVGLAYWLASARSAEDLPIEGVRRESLWGVDLHPGWNLVALPKSRSDWSAARIVTHTRQYFFGDTSAACPVDPTPVWYRDDTANLKNDGEWIPISPDGPTGEVNPWGGYCLWSDSAAALVVRETTAATPRRFRSQSADEAAAADLPADLPVDAPVDAPADVGRSKFTTLPSDAAWSLDFAVESEDSRDGLIRVGVRPGSRTGWDRADVRKPRRPGGGVELAVLQDRFDPDAVPFEDRPTNRESGLPAPRDVSNFLQAFDAPGREAYEWRLRVRGDGPLATLTCVDPSALPFGWQVRLIDLATGRAFDLTRSGSHRFVLQGSREFRLQVGRESEEESFWTPPRTALTAPAPNPSCGPVTLGYTLGQADRVRLEIFDVLGRRVSTVDQGVRDAGTYAVTWSPEEMAGGPGVYLIRLQAGRALDCRKLVRVHAAR